MKVVILAAGRGTRLAPLTDTIPKVLIPICGRAFLSYVLDHLIAAGFSDFGVVVGYKKERVAEFFQVYAQDHRCTITLLEQKEQKGTGDALRVARYFCGEESFVVVGGDGLLSVRDLKKLNVRDDFCYMMGKKVSDPSRYGILKVWDGSRMKQGQTNELFLERVVEKPQQFMGDLASAGIYKFTKDIWVELRDLPLSQRGEIELTDAVNVLAARGKMRVLMIHDYWLDLGKKEDIAMIEEFLKKEK